MHAYMILLLLSEFVCFLFCFVFFCLALSYFFRSLFVCLRELLFWKMNVQYTETHTLFGVFSCDNESYCVIAVDRYPERDEGVAG